MDVLSLLYNGLGGVGLLLMLVRHGRRPEWARAAEAAGLAKVRFSWRLASSTVLTGEAGPLRVRLQGYGNKGGRGTRVVISGLGHERGQLYFRRESRGTSLAGRLGARDIALGDPAFDEKVYVQGSPEVAQAVFDAPARRLVQLLVQGCIEGSGHPGILEIDGAVSLDDGGLQVEIGEPATRVVGGNVVAVLPRLIAIAERLVRPDDLVARLVRNLGEDPLPAVRLANLRMLEERHPDDPRTREALVTALGDADEEVRLRAALALGELGQGTLLEIARSERSDDVRAARAIAALGEHLATAPAVAVLRQSLKLRRLQSAGACVEALRRRRGAEVVEVLATVLAVERRALAAAAARALAGTGEPAAEEPLIQGLHGDSPEVRLAAAEALETVGTAAAVMPLREAAERRPEGGLRRAARQAVVAIQARLQDAAPGQVSLAGPDAGQVSLAADDDLRGLISLPDKTG
jgi:HEAT repeat protein